MQKRNNASSTLNASQWLLLIPAILLLGIAPIFIRYFPVSYPIMPVNWRLTANTTADLFTYGKSSLLLVSGILSVIFLYFRIEKNPLKDKALSKKAIFILATAVWMILTTVTAKFPHMALWGGLEKFEGLFVWLTYIAFACYIGSLVKNENYRLWILRFILFSGLLVTGIGLTQFFSHDLIKMDWFKNLIMPKEIAESAHFVFEANRVYTTLYNPNFVAMYVATLFPLSVFMVYRDKSVVFKILWSLFSVMLIVNLVGSMSSGGFAGIAISIALLVFILIIQRVSSKLRKILVLGSITLSVLVFSLFTIGAFNNLLKVDSFTTHHDLTNVSVKGFEATFDYKGKQLIAQADSNTLNAVRLFDENKTQLNVNRNEDGTYSIVSPNFNNIKFSTGVTADGIAAVNFMIDNYNWMFLLHPNGMIYVNQYSASVPLETSKGLGGFVGHEQFGSARGYIWSRTLPLILESPLVGYGADNFIVAFPQNDYNLKYQLYDTPAIIIDKAHSFPLQLLMNFGVIGTILIFIVIGYAVKTLYSSKNDPDYKLNIVLILCIFGYLGSSLFYDSNLHVSPFFWTFIGFGFKDLFNA